MLCDSPAHILVTVNDRAAHCSHTAALGAWEQMNDQPMLSAKFLRQRKRRAEIIGSRTKRAVGEHLLNCTAPWSRGRIR